MSALPKETPTNSKSTILFVDDEPRVLKAMRAMFRREHEVFTANSAAEGLEIVEREAIQVVVSDQRMPDMTGVEMLTEIKQRAPDIVRILLTGYADLEAIEASLNDAEVYKYLMKPCAADEIRGIVKEALEGRGRARRSAEVIPLLQPETSGTSTSQTRVVGVTIEAAPAAPTEREPTAGAGHILLFGSNELADAVHAAAPDAGVHWARSIDEAAEVSARQAIGIYLIDDGMDELDANLSKLREIMPGDAVAIVASDRSDAAVLIELINSGDVFRFLTKPVQPGRLKLSISSALERSGQASSGPAPRAAPSAWTRFVHWLMGWETP